MCIFQAMHQKLPSDETNRIDRVGSLRDDGMPVRGRRIGQVDAYDTMPRRAVIGAYDQRRTNVIDDVIGRVGRGY